MARTSITRADDLGREGQARRDRGGRAGPPVPLRPAGARGRRAEAGLHLGRRRGRRDALAAGHAAVNGLFNVGTGLARSYLDLARAVCEAAGSRAAIEFIDMPAELRGQYQSFTQARMDRLRAAGYAGQFTPLEDGIRRYVQDYLTQPDPLPLIPVLLFPHFDPVLVQFGPLAHPLVRARLYRRPGARMAADAAAGRGARRRSRRRCRWMTSSPGRRSASSWAGGSATCCSTSRLLPGASAATLFAVWQGGMSFHGGALGVIVAIVCSAGATRIPLLGFGDRIAVVRPDRARASGGSPTSSTASSGAGRRRTGCPGR